jgi:hypothetical protein
MDEVCVGLGFCGSGSRVEGTLLHVTKFIPDEGSVSADQFIEWLFQAERDDPDSRPDKSRAIKDKLHAAFVRHMGSEVVDAKALRWTT